MNPDRRAAAPLDRAAILAQLAKLGIQPPQLDVLPEIDSTSRYLLDSEPLAAGAACLAEAQPQGRGRRGRAWVTTPYANLMLSLAWRFDRGPGALGGFSLAAGVAVLEALDAYGVRDAGLKWPNDILWRSRKLAGLLIDIDGESSGPSRVVIGVGINGYVAPEDGAHIDQPWVDLKEISGAMPDRNRLAALVIERLTVTCRDYAAEGFARFRADWERRHIFHERAVRLLDGATVRTGIVAGVDANGALRLRGDDGREALFHSGDVSLRGNPDE